jgi:VanZ family protein
MFLGKWLRVRFLNNRDRISYRVLICLLAMIIAGMLFFGLRPKGYQPANQVQWIEDGPGISFDRFAVAFTRSEDFSTLRENGFSLLFAVRPEISSRPDFRILIAVHDGDDARQLVIGQWRNWIVAMNGDDYDARRKVRRINVDFSGEEGAVLVAFTSGERGTHAYLNGKLFKTYSALQLNWPNDGGKARMVVGNSIYGRHPWRGQLAGLAVFDTALGEQSIDVLYSEWQQNGKFTFSEQDSLTMLFPLMEGEGEIAHDLSGNRIHLQLPSRMQILKKEVLARVWHLAENTGDLVLDVTLNFFGFLPLGFVLAAVLERGRRFRRYYWQAAILFCFAFSMSIEVAQVWLPSRYSHLMDLVLNTAGGATGVAGYVGVRGRMALLA